MKLNELFNTTSKLNQTTDEDDVDYRTQLSDGTYLKIMFHHVVGAEYECVFARGKRSDFVDAGFGKNGLGNETEVFAVVIQAIKQFISKYEPSMIMFTADKTPNPDEGQPEDTRKLSRTNLYAKMLQRVFSTNRDYVFKKVPYSGFDEYQVIRRDTSSEERANKYDRDFS